VGLLQLLAKVFGISRAPQKPLGQPQSQLRKPVMPSSAGQEQGIEIISQQGGLSISMTATYIGPDLPEVSDAEVAERAQQYAFVINNELPALKAPDQWWSGTTQQRRLGDGSPKAYDWLHPFLSYDQMRQLELLDAIERGPAAMDGTLKKIRALIRERRKAKAAFDDLLKELYGAAVLAHVFDSLKTSFTGHHRMTEFVGINDLKDVRIEYSLLGYQCIETLGKTDVKWLIEAFGEPAEHQSFEALWPHVRQNAISRMCWDGLKRSGAAASLSSKHPAELMQTWIDEHLRRDIGYYKEWQERVVAIKARQAETSTALDAAWAATNAPFVVADLETTGLSGTNDEILEFAAVRVTAAGEIEAEFSVLVRARQPVPSAITKLTGITQKDIDREGRPLAEAMKSFLAFVGARPVFFHNAPFDMRFIKAAASTTGLKLANPVHDTLPLARAAWPTLGSYKLSLLAEHVGAPTPTHRALDDVRSTLAVLLSARRKELAVA
jgi:DNA polymerase-3 subunit epsilon